MTPTPQQIIEAVAKRFNVPLVHMLCGGRRGKPLPQARAYACYLLRRFTRQSFPEITRTLHMKSSGTTQRQFRMAKQRPGWIGDAESIAKESGWEVPLYMRQPEPETPPDMHPEVAAMVRRFRESVEVRNGLIAYLRPLLNATPVAPATP